MHGGHRCFDFCDCCCRFLFLQVLSLVICAGGHQCDDEYAADEIGIGSHGSLFMFAVFKDFNWLYLFMDSNFFISVCIRDMG